MVPSLIDFSCTKKGKKAVVAKLRKETYAGADVNRGRMEARKAALISMKNSHFDQTPQYSGSSI